jgi:hypothetical protein
MRVLENEDNDASAALLIADGLLAERGVIELLRIGKIIFRVFRVIRGERFGRFRRGKAFFAARRRRARHGFQPFDGQRNPGPLLAAQDGDRKCAAKDRQRAKRRQPRDRQAAQNRQPHR